MKLAQALQKISTPPGNPKCGKLFEEVMLRAYRCRAATMKEVVSVAEFLHVEACTVEDIRLRPLQGAITELAPVTIFPCAAVCGEDKFDLLRGVEKENAEHLTKTTGTTGAPHLCPCPHSTVMDGHHQCQPECTSTMLCVMVF